MCYNLMNVIISHVVICNEVVHLAFQMNILGTLQQSSICHSHRFFVYCHQFVTLVGFLFSFFFFFSCFVKQMDTHKVFLD